MKKLLEFLVKSIIDHPQEVKIDEQKETNFVNFILHVHPEDIKIVIGKNGRTIKSLRELIRIRALKEGVRVNLQLQE